MYLEVITVSINYADYLERIVENKKHFDRWLIVTEETDHETINLCKRHTLEFMFSKRIHENGASFARGKALNEGIHCLSKRDWLLHLDSDILLEANFREELENAQLRQDCFYGLPERPVALKEADIARIKNKQGGKPSDEKADFLGYFQLFHASAFTGYSEISNDTSLDDQLFCSKWPEEKRIFLKMNCIHLGEPFTNWTGRFTPKFGRKFNAHMVPKYLKRAIQRMSPAMTNTRVFRNGVYYLKQFFGCGLKP